MTINKRIKELRQKLGQSQATFAKNLCLSNGYFAAIEVESRKANERVVKLISRTYGINEDWLWTGEGDMHQDPSDAGTEQIMKRFRELKPEYQEYMLSLVEKLMQVQNATGKTKATNRERRKKRPYF